MDFMILFVDSVRVGQFGKKKRSESFVRFRQAYNVFSGESWNTRFSAPRSQTIVQTVNTRQQFNAKTQLQLHDYVYFQTTQQWLMCILTKTRQQVLFSERYSQVTD